jgi:hypothetical protein
MTRVVNKKFTKDFDVFIGRPSLFGNPDVIGIHGTREQVIAAYKAAFYERVGSDLKFREEVKALKGKTLGCFCKDPNKEVPCHGDVFVEFLEECPKFRVACVGSREISEEKRLLLSRVGKHIAARNWWLSSGNALGSDIAYASGANEVDPTRVVLYLPWLAYNEEHIVKGNWKSAVIKPEWLEIAKEHHGKWDALGQGGKKMMGRNVGIVSRANVVLAVLNHNKVGFGGTGQAWRVSESLGLPCLDLSLDYKYEYIVSFLEEHYESTRQKNIQLS